MEVCGCYLCSHLSDDMPDVPGIGDPDPVSGRGVEGGQAGEVASVLESASVRVRPLFCWHRVVSFLHVKVPGLFSATQQFRERYVHDQGLVSIAKFNISSETRAVFLLEVKAMGREVREDPSKVFWNFNLQSRGRFTTTVNTGGKSSPVRLDSVSDGYLSEDDNDFFFV